MMNYYKIESDNELDLVSTKWQIPTGKGHRLDIKIEEVKRYIKQRKIYATHKYYTYSVYSNETVTKLTKAQFKAEKLLMVL